MTFFSNHRAGGSLRNRALRVERLEDRSLPSGVPWHWETGSGGEQILIIDGTEGSDTAVVQIGNPGPDGLRHLWIWWNDPGMAGTPVDLGAAPDRIVFNGYGGADSFWFKADSAWFCPVTLNGGEGDDWLHGGDMADEIHGGGGNDHIWGYGGDDWLYGDGGNDVIYGGCEYAFDAWSGGNDWLFGGAGNDTLEGGGGNDFLSGDSGDDTYRFDADMALGSDVLVEWYGGGNDTLDFSGTTTQRINLDLAAVGRAQVVCPYLTLTLGVSYLGVTLGTEVENVIGGSLGDVIYGNDLVNILDGRGGNDQLYGRGNVDYLFGKEGIDSLWGGDGGDFLFGGNEVDFLYGEAGNDFLDGGKGNDWLLGGIGDDTLIGGEGCDFLYGDAGRDTIFANDGFIDYIFYDLFDTLYVDNKPGLKDVCWV